MTGWFSDLSIAADDKKHKIGIVRCKGSVGAYLEIEVVNKDSKILDREKIGPKESADGAAKRLLTRMKRQAML